VNYYEELALPQNASLEELHQSYRTLARLLHPDSQSDPKLRSAAERQMIRLNEMLGVLTDPDKRCNYDESISQKLAVREPVPPPPGAAAHLLYRNWPWGLACCILLAAGAWYLRSNEPDGTAPPGSVAAAPLSVRMPETHRTGDAPHVSQSRPRKSRPPNRSQSPAYESIRKENTASSQAAPRLLEPGKPAMTPQREPAEATATVAQPVPAVPEHAAPIFAGRWLFASRAADPPSPGLYPPEFIELFLSEGQGGLSGRYWARYRIPNKAVSPEVQFRVSGASRKGNAATLSWISDDGAKGQFEMALRGPNSMEVSWWTSAFGQRTGLTSGTAVLVRQQKR